MKVLWILTIIWLSVCTFVLLILHMKGKKLFKSILVNALLGFTAITLINITQKFTGVFIPLNWYTVIGSGVLGLPGVCGVVLLQIVI